MDSVSKLSLEFLYAISMPSQSTRTGYILSTKFYPKQPLCFKKNDNRTYTFSTISFSFPISNYYVVSNINFLPSFLLSLLFFLCSFHLFLFIFSFPPVSPILAFLLLHQCSRFFLTVRFAIAAGY